MRIVSLAKHSGAFSSQDVSCCSLRSVLLLQPQETDVPEAPAPGKVTMVDLLGVNCIVQPFLSA